MTLLQNLAEDKLTPGRLWPRIDIETRRLAARSLYDPASEDRSGRAEADRAIAEALRCRETWVRRLPLDKRVEHIARRVCPDDSLATSLLMALHFTRRRGMLASFLDQLGIPQRDGIIDPDHRVNPLDAGRLSTAVSGLRANFPDDEVDLYLASLVAMDREVWHGLLGILTDPDG